MTAVFFNLLVNSAFSLVCGILVVSFFLWLFRIETGSLKLTFLSLPFVKVVYDFVRGLPADSILFVSLDPFSLPPKHQVLSINAGLNVWSPVVSVQFSVKDLHGKEFAASIGDYLVIWLQRINENFPLIIVCAVLSVSGFLLVRRLLDAIRFEKRRKFDKLHSLHLENRETDFRKVEIYVSSLFSGTPFTGGIISPYICIPEDAFIKLETRELEAVIAHELGHIRQFDLLGTIFIQLLGDLLWFVPGYRVLSRKIDRLREVLADQFAVKAGASPVRLANALLQLKELPQTQERFQLYSAFFREPSLLKTRIDRLLGTSQDKRARLGWRFVWIRAFVSFWIFTAVMFATLGGNPSETKFSNPIWLNEWFRSLGLL